MMRAAVFSLAVVGCGDPELQCPGEPRGTYVAYGAGCATPHAITIDGQFDDWANIPSNYPACADCAAGEVIAVHITSTPDGQLAVYEETKGAPNTDSRHSYLVELGPLDGPTYTLDVYVQPSATTMTLGGTAFSGGAPSTAAFGATGVELALPISFLPFGPGADVEFASLEVEQGGWASVQNTLPPVAYACWDPSSPLCQPL